MFSAATKQFVTLLFCLSVCSTTAAQAQTTETTPSLAELTKATLELRHNLLAAEENFFRRNPNTLTIYINTDNLPAGLFREITLILDGKTIVQHSFSEAELQSLSRGAMENVYAAPIDPGPHELKTIVNGAAASEEQNNTILTLEKGPGHDTLKVTIASPLQKRHPEIFFDQQRGEKP